MKILVLTQLLSDVCGIIAEARASAVRSVDFARVMMYWKLGERIVKEEQGGKTRAGYGSRLLRHLANAIEPEYGSGFSYRQLAFCRQFYLAYPIVNALRSQLNWMQYRCERQPGENPTVGILLCTAKNESVVRMTLPENSKSILASQYHLYMPKAAELKAQLVKERQRIEELLNKSSGKATP